MSRYRTTKKAQMSNNNRIISVGYCNLQYLLSCVEPYAYSAGTYGWSCDYYELPRGLRVSTGYDTCGKHVEYDLLKKYDEAAERICRETWQYDERRKRLNALIEDFAGDVERRYFSGR